MKTTQRAPHYFRSTLLTAWTISTCMTACALAWAQASEPRMNAITEQMKSFVDHSELAGAVTLVAKNGKIVHLDAVGFEDIDGKRPMTTDTMFAIMSMTKPIASVAALILCDEGKLQLDEPIAKHLPEFSEGNRKKITLRHLLSHTSGLGGNQQNEGTLADSSRAFAKRPLGYEPGTKWAYSPGISVAGRLVEVASGQPFDQILTERIFKPLGMNQTTFYMNEAQEQRLAKIYKRSGEDKPLEEVENKFLGPKETRTPNPSGGLFSTARDLERFWQMLLNGGELDGVRILSKEMVREMTTPQTRDLKAGFVPGSKWGLGVGIVSEPTGVTAMLSPGTFGHGGAYGTQVWADPKTKTIYLLLIQRVGILNSDASPYRQAFQEAATKALE
ncbi:MAG: serine hydrolase domain-containing protein [Planctomycetota bacterium]